MDSRDGVNVTTYSGNAKAQISKLTVDGDTISIYGDDALPSKIVASGDPLKFSFADKFSGTAQKVVLLVQELKLTLVDYIITDSSGNRMKGKTATFELSR
jgi:lipopolysaccharide export system protein LptA